MRLASTSAFFIVHSRASRACTFLFHHNILQPSQPSCAGLKSNHQPPQSTALKTDIERRISSRSGGFHDNEPLYALHIMDRSVHTFVRFLKYIALIVT
ncbi:hypothetical protein KC364_g52 [Hortaea werneckii]|nr:hypothetical protein KC364_g52 [Hortaea werneckii]